MKQKFTCIEDVLMQDRVVPYKVNSQSSHSITEGQRFDRLLTVKRVYDISPKGNKDDAWVCICDCGNYTVVRVGNLLHGMTKSCGCILTDLGESRRDTTQKTRIRRKLHAVWLAMKNRCNSPNSKRYNDYGGRGITLYEEWTNSFISFQEWSMQNGYDESLSIDRIDNNKGYYPANCRWTTLEVQSNNCQRSLRAEYNGKKWNATDLAKHLGIRRTSVFAAKYQKRYGIKITRRYEKSTLHKEKQESNCGS